MTSDRDDLDAQMIAAHDGGSPDKRARLYLQAADHFAADRSAARFYLTHAWIFALEAGDEALAASCAARLRDLDR